MPTKEAIAFAEAQPGLSDEEQEIAAHLFDAANDAGERARVALEAYLAAEKTETAPAEELTRLLDAFESSLAGMPAIKARADAETLIATKRREIAIGRGLAAIALHNMRQGLCPEA